jgi:hypothetical protein
MYADRYEQHHNGAGKVFWWVFGPLFVGLLLAATVPACTGPRQPHENWILRVTTTGGIVINQAQGEYCSVGAETAAVWVGDDLIYKVTNNSPNVILSCMRVK